MSWASRRRGMYLFIVFVVIVAIAGAIGYSVFYKPPTCSDGKQNGMEEGIDCGGGCQKICAFSAAKPIVQWSRMFQIIPGAYTTLALVENPNSSVAAHDLAYTFKLRDENNILVREEQGTLFLPPGAVVPVFATGIETGARVPTRVEFSLGQPTWLSEGPSQLDLSIDTVKLEREDTTPRLTARVTNHSLDTIPVLPLVAVLYGADGNAVHASRTILKDVIGKDEREVVFTWPEAFTAPVGKIDIIPVPQER